MTKDAKKDRRVTDIADLWDEEWAEAEEGFDPSDDADPFGVEMLSSEDETEDSAEAPASLTGDDSEMAYIRAVTKAEIDAALPPGAPDGPYFALHDGDGRPLAIFSDEMSAQLAARAHNYQTVRVH